MGRFAILGREGSEDMIRRRARGQMSESFITALFLVMSGGRLAGEVDAATATQEQIMALAAKYA